MRRYLWILAACLFTSYAHGQSTVKYQISLDECNFQLTDPYHGHLTVDNQSTPHSASYVSTINPEAQHPFETWIQFSCENPASVQTFSDLGGIRMTANGWALDASTKVLGEPGQHTTFYPLQGNGWKGGGVTQDDIDGDEEHRTRIFAFCIPHSQLAVCGIARSAGYLKHPGESVLPQIIRLLDSIEFEN